MTEELKQIIKDEVAKLPKERQDAINSLDWAKIAKEIGEKHLLSESGEVNDLQTETLLVLIGLEDLDSYARNIESNIGTSRDEAERIAGEAIELIFTPIYNTLTENVKKNIVTKDPTWKNTIDFVLSDGDYSIFMEKREEREPVADLPLHEDTQKPPLATANMPAATKRLID